MSILAPNINIDAQELHKIESFLTSQKLPSLFEMYGFLTALACACHFDFNKLLQKMKSSVTSSSNAPHNILKTARLAYEDLAKTIRLNNFTFFLSTPVGSDQEAEAASKKELWSRGFCHAVFMFFNDWPQRPALTRPLFYLSSFSMNDNELQETIVLNNLADDVENVRVMAEQNATLFVHEIYIYCAMVLKPKPTDVRRKLH